MSIISEIFGGIRDGIADRFNRANRMCGPGMEFDRAARIEERSPVIRETLRSLNAGNCPFSFNEDGMRGFVRSFMIYVYMRATGQPAGGMSFTQDELEFFSRLPKPALEFLFCKFGYISADGVTSSTINRVGDRDILRYSPDGVPQVSEARKLVKSDEFDYIMHLFTKGHEINYWNGDARIWGIDPGVYGTVQEIMHGGGAPKCLIPEKYRSRPEPRHAPEFKQDNPTSKQFNNKPSKAVKEMYSKLMKKYGDLEKMSGAKTSKDVFIFEYGG